MGVFQRIKALALYEPEPGSSVPSYLFFKNRWFRAVTYLVVCLCTTLIYNGWQPYSMMLIRDGAFKWRCTAEEIATGRVPACDAQDNAVQSVYLVGLSSEFILGILAGVCLDHIGPLATAFIGFSMSFGGWMCMIYSREGLEAYIPGIILSAGAVNMICFPALILGDLFPTRAGLAVSLVVAAQTTSTAVPAILEAIWSANPEWTYRGLIWGYLSLIFLPGFALMMLTLPLKRLNFKPPVLEAEAEPKKELTNIQVADVAPTDDEQKISPSTTIRPSPSEPPKMSETAIGISSKYVRFMDLLHQLLTPEYLLFTLCYIIQVFQYGYYPTITDKHFGSNVARFQGYILPSQGLFGILFGLLVDKTGTLRIFFPLVAMMTLVYGFALAPHVDALQYVATCLFVIANAYFYTVKYTYALEVFPPTHFGVLVGLIGAISGALSLLNIKIRELNFVAVCIGYMLVGCIAMCTIVYLRVRQNRGIHYKDVSPRHSFAPKKGGSEQPNE